MVFVIIIDIMSTMFRLATISDQSPDGRLALVSRCGNRAAFSERFLTLQSALDRWEKALIEFAHIAEAMERDNGAIEVRQLEDAMLLAPLPRAWQWLDGSAYTTHAALMDRAYGIATVDLGRPLMYQGMSHHFCSPTEDIVFVDEEHGIDFEGEVGVIVDYVPMGTSAADALGHIRLIVQINDWSLRKLGAEEMKTGFGWVQAKPACSVAPFAISPEYLGEAWANGRVQATLEVDRDGAEFGRAACAPMAYGFHELIAHAARTRDLCAGTIIGSGTVSNSDYANVGSSCIAERRAIEMIEHGRPSTEFLHDGEIVAMTLVCPDGSRPCGSLRQRVSVWPRTVGS